MKADINSEVVGECCGSGSGWIREYRFDDRGRSEGVKRWSRKVKPCMRVSKKVKRRIQLKQRKRATARKQICERADKADLSKADKQHCSRVADNEQWVEQNFSECGNFRHVLRTQRLMKMAKVLECPDESLPKQNVDWSDVKAAYRFFARKEVTFMPSHSVIMKPHVGLGGGLSHDQRYNRHQSFHA
ncbi:MAG: transposase DNA-binding-containing protein [Planctomycetaceae bacterium]